MNSNKMKIMMNRKERECHQSETLKWLKCLGTSQIFRECWRWFKYDPMVENSTREAHTVLSNPIMA